MARPMELLFLMKEGKKEDIHDVGIFLTVEIRALIFV